MHYVIGDVHGNYNTLLALIAKLPQGAMPVFVGDLVDRGAKSREVIELVRSNGYLCVRGNHEELMIDYGTSFLHTHPRTTNPDFMHMWYNNGGTATLLSYGLVEFKNGLTCKEDEKGLEQFKKDLEWLKTLPLYVRLPFKREGKEVVVTHASCGDVWHHHDNPNARETFREYALWNRTPPNKDAAVFNVYGHTPQEFGPEVEEHYVNVDTGCYIRKHGYNILSAYCVETGDVVSVTYIAD